ncbi:MAG: hypothetical protein HGA66_07705, partial [Holophaga sp.]|nr:hypothetical protein [Holophaga sp.]
MVLGLVLRVPAGATVIQGGASATDNARLEAEAHQAGARHTCVVGLMVQSTGMGMPALGTGVYLGMSADGRRGLILTSAHLFADEGESPIRPRKSTVHFGPAMMVPGASRVAATKVHLHPEFAYFQDLTSRNQDGPLPLTNNRHDLAIVEFDAAAGKDQLMASKVTPAALYDGTGYLKPLLKSGVAGFGVFGTSTSPTVRNLFKVHAGNTRVTYGTWRGRSAFIHLSPLSAQGRAALSSTAPDTNVWQFEPPRPGLKAFPPGLTTAMDVRANANQTLVADGDSGGPLFFETKDGLKVAGIFSFYLCEALRVAGQEEPRTFAVELWEPVKEHLDWIRGVMGLAPGAKEEEKKAPAPPTKVPGAPSVATTAEVA